MDSYHQTYKGEKDMNVLFLTVSTGHGHTSCARALEVYLKENGANTYFLDIYGYIKPFLSKAVSDIYLFASGKTPKLYGKYYDKEDMGKTKFVDTMSKVNKVIKNKFKKFIIKYDIDVVVCTHIFAAQIMTMLKDSVDTVNIGIVTDYTLHPKWETTDIDYYVTADESLSYIAEKKGIAKEKLLPFGIPTDKKFTIKGDKTAARKKLGFTKDKVIFVMMGSMGYGNLDTIIDEIDGCDIDFEVAVACGNNSKAKDMILAKNLKHKFHAYGFINNVDEFMDAADCIITKPGGLSVTESTAKNLPMILVDPIPGQEDRNQEFFLNNGISMAVTKTFPIEEAVFQMLTNEWKMKHGSGAVEYIGKPNATAELYDVVVGALNNKL